MVREVLSGNVELGILALPGAEERPIDHADARKPARPDRTARPQVREQAKVKVTDLNGQDFVHLNVTCRPVRPMDRIFRENKVEVNKVAEFDNIETIKRAVEVGFGLAIVPEPAVSEARKAGTLAVVLWQKNTGPAPLASSTAATGAYRLPRKFVQLLEAKN